MDEKIKILIIEDNAAQLRILTILLERSGYEIHSATDGQAGLDAAMRIHPDLVVVDVIIPGIDGIELCRRLKAASETRDAMVILVSSRMRNSEAMTRALDCGADGYIVRPIPNDELRARIDAVVRIRKLHLQQRFKTRRERVIADLAECALTEMSTDVFLDEVVIRVQEVMGWDLAAVFQWSAHERQYSIRAGRGWPENVVRMPRPMAADEMRAFDYVERNTVIFASRDEMNALPIPEFIAARDMNTGIIVPITGHAGFSGAVGVFACDDHALSDLHLPFIHGIAGLVGLVLKRHDDDRALLDAKRTLLEGKQKLAVTLASIGDGVVATDIDGMITYVNDAGRELMGIYADDVIGCALDSVYRVIIGKTRMPLPYPFGQVLGGHRPHERADDLVLESADGRSHEIADKGAVVADADGKPGGLVIAIRDLTDIRSRERRLKKAYADLESAHRQMLETSRLAALGEIGTGIAHELNQPLTGILNFTKMMLKDMEPSSDLARDLVVIEEQASRMSRLVRKIVSFARHDDDRVSPVSVRDAIDTAVALMAVQFRESSITLNVEIDETFPQVYATVDSLQQIFINFLTNARDAIRAGGSGGCIGIVGSESVAREDLRLLADADVSRIDPTYDSPNHWVSIVVTDDGVDVAPEAEGRLFESFTTSKPAGTGTGLGLSLVRKICREVGGAVGFRRGPANDKQFVVLLRRVGDT